jgi:beta-glucosidase
MPVRADPASTLDVERLVLELSLEQKVRLLTGAGVWSLHGERAIGLRRLVVSDGPAGVRGTTWDERDTSANAPCATALAATWDEALLETVGQLLAGEARRKGVDVLLAPTVNLQRTPYGGRNFECFGEDPLLTARLGTAYVRGVQNGGVAATVKHFVANDSETERMTADVRLDERTLRELYLQPFEAIVREAGVWCVMAAYNRVDGHAMSASPLLRDVLRKEWGFDGVIMSDWYAAKETIATAGGELDLVMPGPAGPWGDALVAAVRAGQVDEAVVDEKVGHVLRLAGRVGALDGVPARSGASQTPASVAATLRRAAAKGFVLAANRGVLPLDQRSLRQVAVVGPNAAVGRTLGGGSAMVFPPYVVSPLEGIRTAVGPGVAVDHAIGAFSGSRRPVARREWLRQPDGDGEGVEARFLRRDGSTVGIQRRLGAAFNWEASFGQGAADDEIALVEIRTTVRADAPGTYEIGCSGVGRYRLVLGGDEVFHADLSLPAGSDIVEAQMSPPQRVHPVKLAAGEEVSVVLSHVVGSMQNDLGVRGAAFQLNLQPPRSTDEAELERAVALAQQADVAIVVVGTTEEVESEGFDRTSLALPGRQDELVRRVAEANPRTVVVVNSGAPVLMPWADDVAAVLLVWFPGQEFGNALADVLLGAVEPGGRLPSSWPAAEAELPSTQPMNGSLAYEEGARFGYRADRNWRFPFGHGLGYTEWDYVSIDAPSEVAAGDDVVVVIRLRNRGTRRGRQIVQVYGSRADSAVSRPPRWLIGFAVAEADPGKEVEVLARVRARALEHWDVDGGRWTVEPGTFGIQAGSSSAVLPLASRVEVRR